MDRAAKMDEMLSIRQVIAELGIGRSTAWRLIEKGELGYHRFGEKVIRVPRGELDAYKVRTRCHGREGGTSDAA